MHPTFEILLITNGWRIAMMAVGMMMTPKLSVYIITKYLTQAAIIVAPIDIFN